MKRMLLVVLLTTQIVANSLFAQDKKAEILFKSTTCDLGNVIESKGVVNAVFMFSNNGKAPLVIHRVISSCDCAVVEWSKEPILPGARSDIKVAFDPKDKVGKFEKLITIYSNALTPTIVLQIRGVVQGVKINLPDDSFNRVIGDFRFKNVHVAIGKAYMNEVKVDTIEFIYTGKDPVKMGAKLVNMSYLGVKFMPEVLKTNEKGLIIIAFDAKVKNDWGFFVDRFTLTQNDKDIINSMITVSGTIEENFSSLNDAQRANAPKIDMLEQNFEFGEVKENDVVEKEFTFTNTGKSDLIIRKIKASCGCTTVEPADKVIKPGKSSSITATIRTNGFSGRIAKTVSIITNDPITPTVVVRMTATVLAGNK